MLAEYVDLVAEAGVKVLLCNTNARKTNYRSGVWEAFWDGYEPEGGDDQEYLRRMPEAGRESYRRLVHSMWALDAQGVDYPARMVARAREKGMAGWISLRMNDVHFNDDLNHPFHGELWREAKYHLGGDFGYFARGLDYGQAEVREMYFKLIVETLERYDIDGLELDFMREPYLFREGQEAAGAAVLTEWLRGVRKLVEETAARRGHAVKLGVRVPSRVEVATGWGLEVVKWAQDGLADLVVVTPRWATLEYDMPIGEWKRLLEGTGVTLAGGLEINHNPVPGTKLQTVRPEQARGAAATVLEGGADAVYLFNYFGSIIGGGEWTRDEYLRTLRAMRSLGELERLPRRHAVTWRDIVGPKEKYEAPLPAEGRELRFEVATGPAPEAGAKVGLELALEGEAKAPAVTVNGVAGVLEAREGGVVRFGVPVKALEGRERAEVQVKAAEGETVRVVGVEVVIGGPAKGGRP
ncbi:MAG: hypothetical protein ABFE08_18725 [Armatimonadia bacterium]